MKHRAISLRRLSFLLFNNVKQRRFTIIQLQQRIAVKLCETV